MQFPETASPSGLPVNLVDEASVADEARKSERRDLARELHDTVIQPLTSLVMSIESLDYQPHAEGMLEAYLGAWRELTQEALDSLRSVLMGLRIHPHAHLGLPEALRHYLAPQIRSRGVRLAVECKAWPEDVPLAFTSQLYLVVREALTNVEKHAHASEVTVLLRGDQEQLCVIVSDNGVGLPQRGEDRVKSKQSGGGLGLDDMRDRAAALNGQLLIITSPGGGVQIEIRAPYVPGATSPQRQYHAL